MNTSNPDKTAVEIPVIDTRRFTFPIDPVAFSTGVAVILLTTWPYVFGYLRAHGRMFMGCLDNVNDYSQYLAWMRQGMQNQWYSPSLFEIRAAPMLVISPFYAFLGLLCRLLHQSLTTGIQAARIIFDVVLLTTTWRLIKFIVEDTWTRRVAMLFTCLSSGFGYLSYLLGAHRLPTDLVQPETTLFYSALTFPGMAFSQTLQIAALLAMLTAEKKGQIRYAVVAGVIGFFICLTHTYDCLSLSAVWGSYLAVRAILKQPGIVNSVLRALAAILIASPGLLPTVYELRHNPAFAVLTKVAANTPPLQYVVLGYGLPFILGLAGAWLVLAKSRGNGRKVDETTGISFENGLFLICWWIANISVSYLPVWSQRRLLQGTQYPISLLAAVGLMAFLMRETATNRRPRIAVAVALIVLLATPTNILILTQSIGRLEANRDQFGYGRLYLEPGEVAAMNWIDKFTPAAAPVQPLPDMGVSSSGAPAIVDTTMAFYAPAMTDHPVYVGNVYNSPNFFPRLRNVVSLGSGRIPDDQRRKFLELTGIRYLVVSHGYQPPGYDSIFAPGYPKPRYLALVFENSDESIYLVTSTS